MESEVKKSYYIWKWIITGIIILAVFAAGCLSGAVIYELSGNGIARVMGNMPVVYMRDFNSYTVRNLEKYDVNLPETAEFVMGYKIISRETYIAVLFTVTESDFDSLLGDTWSSVNGNLEDTDIMTSKFGLYPYRGVMNNKQWQFDKEMKCSLRSYLRLYISKSIDGKVAVAFIYY